MAGKIRVGGYHAGRWREGELTGNGGKFVFNGWATDEIWTEVLFDGYQAPPTATRPCGKR